MSFELSKTFCVMPWVGISGDMDGKFRLCCFDNVSREENTFWTIADRKIEQHWNQEALREIRIKMLKWEKVNHCRTCYKREKLTGLSERQKSNNKYRQYITSIYSSTNKSGHTISPILYLDIRFSNICNLSCRMCYSASSSGRIELDRLLGKSEFLRIYSWFWKESDIFNSWFFLSNLKEIYIAWWEPLLDKDQFNFIQSLTDRWLASKIKLTYNTNLTVLPERLFSLLQNFKEVHIIVSCDGYKESYEYIRIGASWNIFLQNLIQLKNFFIKNPALRYSISINTVLQRDNILDIPKLYIFFKKLWNIPITINTLVSPSYLAVEYILNKRKKEIQIFYDVFIYKFKSDFPEIEEDLSFISDMMSRTTESLVEEKKYRKKTEIIDAYMNRRNQLWVWEKKDNIDTE